MPKTPPEDRVGFFVWCGDLALSFPQQDPRLIIGELL